MSILKRDLKEPKEKIINGDLDTVQQYKCKNCYDVNDVVNENIDNKIYFSPICGQLSAQELLLNGAKKPILLFSLGSDDRPVTQDDIEAFINVLNINTKFNALVVPFPVIIDEIPTDEPNKQIFICNLGSKDKVLVQLDYDVFQESLQNIIEHVAPDSEYEYCFLMGNNN